jgi:hypothetical protein
MMPIAACLAATLLPAVARAAPAEAPPAGGLILWLDAADPATLTLEGDRVLSWASKAPGAPALLTAHESFRPGWLETPGRGPAAALHFDGRNDLLRCPIFGRRAATWTLVALVAPLSPARGAILSACATGGNDYDGFTVDLFDSTRRFDYLSVEGAGRLGGRQNQRTAASPAGPFSFVVVTRDDTEVRLAVDGQPEASRPVSPAETPMDEIRLGARCFGGREREFLRGDIAEVLLYDRVLTDTECQALARSRLTTPAQRRAGEDYAMSLDARNADSRMVPPQTIQSWPDKAAYLAAREAGESLAGPALPLEALPIRRDLLEAIRLSMHCLNSAFDADRDGEPFFYSNCRVDGTGEFHHSVNIGIPHVVGRCLLGNMAASLATGIAFPPDGLAILTRYLKRSFDNPDHLNSYLDPARGGSRHIEFHNMREGLWGLWAVMHTPDAEWARETAHAMLQTLDSLTDESGRWSQALIEAHGMADRCEGVSPPNAARMVDPLLAVHGLTGDPLALKLAGLYARAGLAEIFTPEGRCTEWTRSSGHVHSITSSLSGITEYALLTGDADMLAECRRIMDVGMPDYFSSWGWGDEVFPDHPADEVGRGEMNQTGDVIRAALLLGAAGEPRYYELAERYLRSMVIPCQHREPELRQFLHDAPAPASDAERVVVTRSIGGWAMQLPNARMQEGDWPVQTQDITSGALHAMAECWRHRVTLAAGVASVNLLLDYDGDALSVQSGLPLEGRLGFTLKQPLRLRLRVPGWADPATLRATVGGVPRPVAVSAGYADLGDLQPGDSGALTFAVPFREERETVDGTTYTTTWAGDQILDIRPRGAVSPLPF